MRSHDAISHPIFNRLGQVSRLSRLLRWSHDTILQQFSSHKTYCKPTSILYFWRGCLFVWFVLGAFCVTCRCYCRLFWAVTCLFFFHRFTTDLHTHTQMGFSILLLLGLVVAALFLIFLVCVLSICFVNLCCPSESVHPYNQRPYVIGQSPYVIGQRQDDFVWKP